MASAVIDFLHTLAKRLPEVKKPDRPPTTKERLMWTGVALIIFFAMYHVTAFGVNAPVGSVDFLQTITASRLGSLVTIGIGPIVLASIFLQLFVGAGLLNLDMKNKDEKQKFHAAQKILAIILAIIEGTIFVYATMVLLQPMFPMLGEGIVQETVNVNGVDQVIQKTYAPYTMIVVILQITLGSIFLLYLDEIVSKYGIGSGISLFIAAGVSLAIMGGIIGLIFGSNGVVEALTSGGAEAIPNALLAFMPFIITILVFIICVYAESTKVEIPIAFERIKGFAPKLPLRFFYVSNIPVIFASALLVNVSLFAGGLLPQAPPVDGQYQITQQIGGALYLLTPVSGAGKGTLAHMEYLTQRVTPVLGIPEWIHAIIYVIFLTLLSLVFGIFWAETSNMDAKSVANQLSDSGLQIPGFRKDPRMLETILNKYIFPLTILGSVSVGLLAGLADLTGALGTGTGILLTVGILYKMYEQMEQMKMFELYPALGSIVGSK